MTKSTNSSDQNVIVPTIIPAPYASSSFSFLIPYNQTQSCDIYGPICQTGFITVAVSLNSTRTTSSTLACSSYLTAQSAYLSAFNDPQQPGANFPFWPYDWQSNFGRSPECKSYARAYDNQGQITLSGCDTPQSVVSAQQSDGELPSQLPPGVLRHQEMLRYECCGNCSVDVPQVRLYYFPDPDAAKYCANETQASEGNLTTRAVDRRAITPNAGEVTATLSGYTLHDSSPLVNRNH